MFYNNIEMHPFQPLNVFFLILFFNVTINTHQGTCSVKSQSSWLTHFLRRTLSSLRTKNRLMQKFSVLSRNRSYPFVGRRSSRVIAGSRAARCRSGCRFCRRSFEVQISQGISRIFGRRGDTWLPRLTVLSDLLTHLVCAGVRVTRSVAAAGWWS